MMALILRLIFIKIQEVKLTELVKLKKFNKVNPIKECQQNFSLWAQFFYFSRIVIKETKTKFVIFYVRTKRKIKSVFKILVY